MVTIFVTILLFDSTCCKINIVSGFYIHINEVLEMYCTHIFKIFCRIQCQNV